MKIFKSKNKNKKQNKSAKEKWILVQNAVKEGRLRILSDPMTSSKLVQDRLAKFNIDVKSFVEKLENSDEAGYNYAMSLKVLLETSPSLDTVENRRKIRKVLENVIQNDPLHDRAKFHLAKEYIRCACTEIEYRGIVELLASIHDEVDCIEIQRMLAEVYSILGESEKSIEYFNLADNPAQDKVASTCVTAESILNISKSYHLMHHYYMIGNMDKAIQYYRKVSGDVKGSYQEQMELIVKDMYWFDDQK